MKLYGELFEDSREALLNALADAIDGYDRSRSKLADSAPESGDAEEPQQGDFLYDFTRLNLQYLNHMARLGSNYSIVAGRALERLYDQFIPKAEPEAPPPLAVSGIEGECKRVRVTVTNSDKQTAWFELSLTCAALPAAVVVPELRLQGAPLAAGDRRDLLRTRSVAIDVLVKFPPELVIGTAYTLEVQLAQAAGKNSLKASPSSITIRRVGE